jgi:hypothetical protein
MTRAITGKTSPDTAILLGMIAVFESRRLLPELAD